MHFRDILWRMYGKYVKVYLISFTKVYRIFFAYVKYTNAKFSTIVIFFKETVSIYTIKICSMCCLHVLYKLFYNTAYCFWSISKFSYMFIINYQLQFYVENSLLVYKYSSRWEILMSVADIYRHLKWMVIVQTIRIEFSYNWEPLLRWNIRKVLMTMWYRTRKWN